MMRFICAQLAMMLLVVIVLGGVGCGKKGPVSRARDARVAAASTEVNSLDVSLEVFQIAHDRYPTNEEGLQALVMAPPNMPKWDGPFIEKVSNDPWGRPYVYRIPSTKHPKKSFDVFSVGPDGVADTADDIGSWETK